MFGHAGVLDTAPLELAQRAGLGIVVSPLAGDSGASRVPDG